ncbi:MAG: WhiB family transcriptional regulator [Actinomycetaceae bacterium]|nr:WhiB family transcriptional regulator [Actinomycetaceae bacterium]MDY6082269.1 WhiB family transcriptional regulator [Actinomycetaceae bacterium]
MSVTTDDQSWVVQGACTNADPDLLFVRGSAQRQVRQMCYRCPVRLECLAESLESGSTYGVWGGLTERERNHLLRRFPGVTDWTERIASGSEKIFVDIRAGRVPHLSYR